MSISIKWDIYLPLVYTLVVEQLITNKFLIGNIINTNSYLGLPLIYIHVLYYQDRFNDYFVPNLVVSMAYLELSPGGG